MRIHIVQKGDTLYEIAKQYGVDFEELVRLNTQLSSPDMIMPGMKIKVPSESKQVRSNTDKSTSVEQVQTEKAEKIESTAPVEEETVSPARDKKVEQEVKPIERKTLEKEARPIERPIGKEISDDRTKPKKLEPKTPKEAYPVRPIIEAPTMPKKMKVEELSPQVKGTQAEKDTPYVMSEKDDAYPRQMREPLPVQQAMNQAMDYYYPVNQQMMMGTCHCCHCCSCRRGPMIQRCGCSSRPQQRGNYFQHQPAPYYQSMPYYHQSYHQTY